MHTFLSCDWGTSSFRLRLVDTADLSIILEEKSEMGTARTFAEWQKTGRQNPAERLDFYLLQIRKYIQEMENRLAVSLSQVPVVISGMASSSIGMLELPYQQLPFPVTGAGLQTKNIPPQDLFPHEVLLISGIRSADDVMRGEETQLIGVIAGQQIADDSGTYIFPGTHSKHIEVNDGQVTGFKTYMTGEIFDLLAHKSILQASVRGPETGAEEKSEYFRQGVKDASQTNILHAAFRVRINELFGKLSKEENYTYLSGLVIGSELKDLLNLRNQSKIYLLCGVHLKRYYELAFQELGLSKRVHTFPAAWVDEAVVRGQFKILNQLIINA